MHILFGLFLMAHGWVHATYFYPKPDDPSYPFDLSKGWFAQVVGDWGKNIGVALALITVATLLLAGFGVFGWLGLGDYWRVLATTGLVSSTLLLILFWHPWLILGFVFNALLLVGMYQFGWPFGD